MPTCPIRLAGVFSKTTAEQPASSSSVQLHCEAASADVESALGQESGKGRSSRRADAQDRPDPRTPTSSRAGVVFRHRVGPLPLHAEHILADAALGGRVAKNQSACARGDRLRAAGDDLPVARKFVRDRLPQRRIEPRGDHERLAREDGFRSDDALDGQIAGPGALHRAVIDGDAGSRRAALPARRCRGRSTVRRKARESARNPLCRSATTPNRAHRPGGKPRGRPPRRSRRTCPIAATAPPPRSRRRKPPRACRRNALRNGRCRRPP